MQGDHVTTRFRSSRDRDVVPLPSAWCGERATPLCPALPHTHAARPLPYCIAARTSSAMSLTRCRCRACAPTDSFCKRVRPPQQGPPALGSLPPSQLRRRSFAPPECPQAAAGRSPSTAPSPPPQLCATPSLHLHSQACLRA